MIFTSLTIYLPLTAEGFLQHRMFNIGLLALIGITAGMFGWGMGIFLSPIGQQGKGVAVVTSAVASFWTGVIVSHIEIISRTVMGLVHGAPSQAAKVRLLFGGGVFLMALFVTWNSRFLPAETKVVDAKDQLAIHA